MPDMGNIRIKDENMNKTTIITNVQTRLFELQDLKYRDFHAKLMPTVNKEKIIGVRTPALRVFAKKYGKTDEAKEYLQILPHQYYEENNLHGLLIEQIKDYDICLEELERFLPYIDNWATCDMLAVKVVKKHLDTFIDEIRPCIYHPVRYQYADALLSGRCISDGVPGESGTDPFGRILCKYDVCMVFCDGACKAV
jgi:hypothetical protein